ncbi:hypothetical protein [Protaetiibacter larvae]|uniref:Uncharacterized protein n=1 Tax=Protaetiibacter larvae TaxID=2592654 RepID=A0A5C1Y599_9MICO|nr:hypothetical protein [Protaetiibacter larvae]QEO08578.1 hypothetical protein FLP23_00160 [Protaetiibacter larvae]
MRWDELFADLEGQLEQELDAERLDLAAEEERLRLGRLTIRDRLMAMSRGGAVVRVALIDGATVRLRIDTAGRDWIAGSPEAGAGSVLVPLAAVAAVLPEGDQLARGLSIRSPEPGAELAGRLGLGFVLRDLCRRRAGVDVVTGDGIHHGTIDRVGRDHLDLAEHEEGSAPRGGAVRRVRIIPFGRITCVRL